MKNNSIWQIIAISMIGLVISISFSIAEVYASLEITRSSGSGNIDNYFDGKGDNWTIEAVADLGGRTVQPEMIILRFPVGDRHFQTCEKQNDHYLCKWESGYMTAPEGSYSVDAVLHDPVLAVDYSDKAELIVDGSKPMIQSLQTTQEGNEIKISIIVSDSKIVNNAETSSGLDRIEVWNGDNLIAKVENISSTDYEGDLVADLPAEGSFMQNFLIKVYDRIGHVTAVASEQYAIDFSIPKILTESFKIGELVDWAPSQPGKFDISVEIIEDEGLSKVVGDFSQLGLSSDEVADKCEETAPMHFKCYWYDRLVSFPGNVRLKISATDLRGNVGAAYVERAFMVDQARPVILSFESEGFYNGTNYANKNRLTRLIARIQEAESGISAENILFDVDYVVSGGAGTHKKVHAENCSEVESGVYECYLDIALQNYGIAFLTSVEDNAGNSVSIDELETLGRIKLERDEDAPVIEKIEVKATAGMYGTEKEYFESNDFINLRVYAKDKIGVRCYADLRNVVLGINEYVPADDCSLQQDGSWLCEWLGKGPIRSGYAKGYYRIRCEDYVGNNAEKDGVIEILGKKIETHPDFWKIASIEMMPSFLDRSMTKAMRSRVYFDIELHSLNPNVEFLDARLEECNGKSIPACGDDCLIDYYVVNNVPGSEHPYIVLEFKQFNAEGVDLLHYNCTLEIFSKYGAFALQNPEEEVIQLDVPVGESGFGKIDDNLKNKIERVKKRIDGIWRTITDTREAIEWCKWGCRALFILDVPVRAIIDIVNRKGEGARTLPGGTAIASSICLFSEQTKKQLSWTPAKWLKPLCYFVSCRGPAWYDKYKEAIAKFLTAEVGKATRGVSLPFTPGAIERAVGLTPDPYRSLTMAVATLCIPAIIYNLDKLRQIDCRYLYCLKNEVPAGIVTVRGCKELRRYMACKYVWGEVFEFIPFAKFVDRGLALLKSYLKDPIALVRLGAAIYCKKWCAGSNIGTVECSVAAWTFAILDLINDIAMLEKEVKSIKFDYCKLK
ncbi:hypothetical protein DRZ77_03015 [Candidatus Woesearchaeota archaeon]|nr:hypothetical protein [Candidatus Woesearchaeota archaeon]RLE40112.1 MAG: hypothetical protein DRZ77_03015 [Candidatus Woesearchaeota archaeon]